MGIFWHSFLKYGNSFIGFKRNISFFRKKKDIDNKKSLYKNIELKIYNILKNVDSKIYLSNILDSKNFYRNNVRYNTYIDKKYKLDSIIDRHLVFLKKEDIIIKNLDKKIYFSEDKSKINILYKNFLENEFFRNKYLAKSISFYIEKNCISNLKQKRESKYSYKKDKKVFIKNISSERAYKEFVEKNNEKIVQKDSFTEKIKEDRNEILKILLEERFLEKYSSELDYEFIFDRVKEMIFEELAFLCGFEF